MITIEEDGRAIKLDNDILFVQYDLTEDVFSVRSGDKWFLKGGQFEKDSALDTRIIEIKDDLGTARAVQAEYSSGCVYTIALYEGSPFIWVRVTITKTEQTTIDRITPFAATIDLDVPAESLRVLGCDGLDSASKPRTSYMFHAIADPETRSGAVYGWLTDNRGSGIVSSGEKDGLIHVDGFVEYGKLKIRPGETAVGETLVVGFFDDTLNGLEAYADAIAKANNITLPEAISGYCTWYHSRALDEERMAELADFCGENLRQYGLEFLQIDDGWQISRRDFTTHNPEGPYPGGMRPTAEAIKSQGLKAGLWLTPFGWDSERPGFPDEWFVKREEDGAVYDVHWGGDCLDMTHPEARALLREVAERVTKEWGYKYLKLDALWTGIAVKILYPEPTYRDDGLGDAVFHNPEKTNVEAYRDGLKLVREAAGGDVFLLGCTISQNMRSFGGSFGLVDAIRVGRDIGAKWESILPCAQIGSHLYFLNGKVWYNDPDCLMLRDPLTLDQARAWGSWIAISGQLNVVSEWLPGLPPEKLDVVKRTMPNHGRSGRPIDLFQSPVPGIWYLPDANVMGMFNWDAENEAQITVELADIGLSPDEQYVGFDFWENEFVPPFTGQIRSSLRPGSCRIIAVRRLHGYPQLVSTSRHVTQGLVDVVEEKWDNEKNTLMGKSRVVGGDDYELRIFAPDKWQAVSASASALTIDVEQSGPEVRATVKSETDGEISWRLVFKQTGSDTD